MYRPVCRLNFGRRMTFSPDECRRYRFKKPFSPFGKSRGPEFGNDPRHHAGTGPPSWAAQQRHLMAAMEESVHALVDRYVRDNGGRSFIPALLLQTL